MHTEAIALEKATEEVNSWLDRKRVNEGRRKDLEKPIEQIVQMVQSGNLSIADDGRLTYNLLFPIEDSEGRVAYSSLEFKPRLTVLDIQNRTKGVKAGDADGRISATISALTGLAMGILAKLDTEDNRTAEAIAVFFL